VLFVWQHWWQRLVVGGFSLSFVHFFLHSPLTDLRIEILMVLHLLFSSFIHMFYSAVFSLSLRTFYHRCSASNVSDVSVARHGQQKLTVAASTNQKTEFGENTDVQWLDFFLIPLAIIRMHFVCVTLGGDREKVIRQQFDCLNKVCYWMLFLSLLVFQRVDNSR
jgi:hypothetical protein